MECRLQVIENPKPGKDGNWPWLDHTPRTARSTLAAS
jgi:hypothetical protein